MVNFCRELKNMNFLELILLAFGLAMDAFAVSVCKGLATQKVKIKHMVLAGIWFGGFQALMPTLGYFLGSAFGQYISSIDHYIAFGLLAIIGGNMIKEAFEKEEETTNCSFRCTVMLAAAIATSIDALAVGVTFALLPNLNLWLAVGLIGGITFALSAAGIKIGSIFGGKFQNKAQFAGGVILIVLGIKILLEGIGIL